MRWAIAASVVVWVGMRACAGERTDRVAIGHTYREWSADPKKDPKHAGLVWIERRVHVDNAAFWLKSVIDPKQGRRPVVRGYGDFFFGLRFGGFGNGGWNRWGFLSVACAYGKGKATDVTQRQAHVGGYVLERGRRGVVEFVWHMPPVPGGTDPPGEMRARVVKWHDQPEWLYLQVSIDPGHEAALRRVSVSAYPGQTSGPAVRQRWVTTPVRSHALPSGVLQADPAREHALSLHNKYAHEHDACLLVCDPQQIAQVRVSGTYGVSVGLSPVPGRQAVQVALGYFRKTYYPKGNAAFLASVPERLKRLRQVRWQADVLSGVDWDAHRARVARLMKHRRVHEAFAGPVKAIDDRFAKLREALRSPQRTPGERARLERQVPELADQARRLVDRMYPVAIEDLIASD